MEQSGTSSGVTDTLMNARKLGQVEGFDRANPTLAPKELERRLSSHQVLYESLEALMRLQSCDYRSREESDALIRRAKEALEEHQRRQDEVKAGTGQERQPGV